MVFGTFRSFAGLRAWAFLAGAVLLVVEEVGVGLADEILAVIVDDGLFLMQRAVALGTEPQETIDLAITPAALDDQDEGIGRKPG
jgi:hypothetical protein